MDKMTCIYAAYMLGRDLHIAFSEVFERRGPPTEHWFETLADTLYDIALHASVLRDCVPQHIAEILKSIEKIAEEASHAAESRDELKIEELVRKLEDEVTDLELELEEAVRTEIEKIKMRKRRRTRKTKQTESVTSLMKCPYCGMPVPSEEYVTHITRCRELYLRRWGI